MGLWTGHGTKEVVRHYLPSLWCRTSVPTARTVPLLWGKRLSPRSAASPTAVGLSSGAVCAASVENVILEGRRFCRSSRCSLPHRLSALLVLWYRRYGPTSLSLGGRTDGRMNKCPVSTPSTSHPQHGGVRQYV